ncbi:MAG: hypothetical protein ACRD2J_04550 [Thermoanaerobaculia bacterium]
MRAMMMISALCLSLALLAGCNAGQEKPIAATPAAELSPEELAAVASEVRSAPERAQEILAARGLTEEGFEQAIRDTTENPETARRYAEAFEGS